LKVNLQYLECMLESAFGIKVLNTKKWEFELKQLIKKLLPLFDILALPLIYPAAFLLKMVRKAGVTNMPFCKSAFKQVGVFPILNHYYEPLFDDRQITKPLNDVRNLPGIDWNDEGQLSILQQFNFNDELKQIPLNKAGELDFYVNNPAFTSGDAEYFYNLIRLKKPTKIFEVGSGYSTLLAVQAIKKNQEESATYQCKHVCIEPYEMPWLEKTGVTVIRERVEQVDKSLFLELGENDILFIDSSHIIRPQGDVIYEYLELLPILKAGVIVHIHDIFSPHDYLKQWVVDEVKLWNEQYLLEAFLTDNKKWKIIGALNYLHHTHYSELKRISPFLHEKREPGSFYIQKVS
jgi:predicted O-methyltransferase YrrM